VYRISGLFQQTNPTNLRSAIPVKFFQIEEMKVQMKLNVKANADENLTFDLVVSAGDTVAGIKDRVMALQLIPFTENDLKLDGEVLMDGKRLSDCGVKEGSSLDFEVKASESSLSRQLIELLQARDLSTNELGMLYCYKHGVNINQSLKFVGHEGKLADFLKRQKGLSLDNGRVALKREESALKPFSVTDEVAQILQDGSGVMDIRDLKAAFVQKFNVSMASITAMKPTDFLAKHNDLFTVTGRFVSLKGADREQTHVGQQHTQVLPPPGLEIVANHTPIDQQYLDLHSEICGVGIISKTTQALDKIVDAIADVMFLNVDHIVRGGSVGKGTSTSGVSDAEVTFFLTGMPTTGQDVWMPPLLKAVCGVLSTSLGADEGVQNMRATDDSLQLSVQDLISVDVRFSPVFQSYAKIIDLLGEQDSESRRYLSVSLSKERTLFISQQPQSVKVTIQLLKWWRDKQIWSHNASRPTDDILELMAVYSAVQTKPTDQRTAIANVMSLFSQFNDLRIVWSNYYSKGDVWAPLMRQRPLLMDPTNPYVNIADPQLFDASELMSFASSTHFF